MLYLGRRRNAYILGLPLPESEALLDELWSFASQDELTWYNKWRTGDLVLWDNRCTMHRRDPFDAGARRIMHRTQIKGEARPCRMNNPRGMAALRLRPPGIVLLLLCAMYFLLFVNRTNHRDRGPADAGGPEALNTGLGLAFSAFAYPYALFQLFGGMLGDKFGPRLTLGICDIRVALATAWTAPRRFGVAVLARVGTGHWRGRSFSNRHPRNVRVDAAAELGVCARHHPHVFPHWQSGHRLIVAGLIALLSWRASFFLLAPVNLVWMLVWLWYFRDRSSDHPAMTAA